MVRVFKVPGKIQAKQRPRFANGRVYTPGATVNYENLVKLCYSDYAILHDWKPIEGAIRAEIEVFMPIPKSDSKKVKVLKLEGRVRPTIKCDCDNAAKSILDSLNGIAYKDDSQVVELLVKKFYSDEPSVYVKLIELEVAGNE